LVCSLLLLPPAFGQFVQQGPKLVGTGYFKLGGSVFQGAAVSLSADGNTAIIGGSGDNFSTGGVWIWTRSGGVWTQQSPKLVGTGAAEGSTEGNAVAISADGNTAIVGAAGDDRDAFDNHHGSAWIWTRSGNLWTQQGPKLVGSDAAGAAQQGTSVAISADGNTVIIGGSSDNGSLGASWIWARSAGVWSQQGPKLVASDTFGPAKQGSSVSLSADGNTAIVGGFLDHNNDGGAWIWTRSGGVWSQQGPRLFGSGATVNPRQGTSVAISADGNTAVVGGYLDNNQGAVWIWTRSGSVWTQQGSKLVGFGAVGNAAQGSKVAISGDGNTALVGGPSDNNLAGAVWVWKRNDGIWTQQGTKLVGAGAVGTVVEQSAVSISSDGRTAIVGGPLDDGGFGFATGATWIFAAATADLTITKSDIGSFHQGDSGRHLRDPRDQRRCGSDLRCGCRLGHAACRADSERAEWSDRRMELLHQWTDADLHEERCDCRRSGIPSDLRERERGQQRIAQRDQHGYGFGRRGEQHRQRYRQRSDHDHCAVDSIPDR
jgi:hypothetical protein